MAIALPFSKDPYLVTSADLSSPIDGYQPLSQSIPIIGFNQLDVLFGILAFTGGATSAVVSLWTGMQSDSNDGWVQLYSFGSVGLNDWQKAAIGPAYGLLAYARWKVISFAGGSNPRSVTFALRGLGR